MSEICKKASISTGVPQEQAEKLMKFWVKDGIISTTWPFYDEVISFYKQNKHLGKAEAVKMAADKFKISDRQIYNIIAKI